MSAWKVLILPSLNSLLMGSMALMLSRGPAGVITGEACCLWIWNGSFKYKHEMWKGRMWHVTPAHLGAACIHCPAPSCFLQAISPGCHSGSHSFSGFSSCRKFLQSQMLDLIAFYLGSTSRSFFRLPHSPLFLLLLYQLLPRILIHWAWAAAQKLSQWDQSPGQKSGETPATETAWVGQEGGTKCHVQEGFR